MRRGATKAFEPIPAIWKRSGSPWAFEKAVATEAMIKGVARLETTPLISLERQLGNDHTDAVTLMEKFDSFIYDGGRIALGYAKE